MKPVELLNFLSFNEPYVWLRKSLKSILITFMVILILFLKGSIKYRRTFHVLNKFKIAALQYQSVKGFENFPLQKNVHIPRQVVLPTIWNIIQSFTIDEWIEGICRKVWFCISFFFLYCVHKKLDVYTNKNFLL